MKFLYNLLGALFEAKKIERNIENKGNQKTLKQQKPKNKEHFYNEIYIQFTLIMSQHLFEESKAITKPFMKIVYFVT